MTKLSIDTLKCTQLISLDLLPKSLINDFSNAEMMRPILRIYDLVLAVMRASLHAFYQEKQHHLFNPYIKENACQIRAAQQVLFAHNHHKSEKIIADKILNLMQIQSRLRQRIQDICAANHSSSLKHYLKKHGLIFSIDLIDQYLFISYFLTAFRGQSTEDLKHMNHGMIAHSAGVDETLAVMLTEHYEALLAAYSAETIINWAADLGLDDDQVQILKKMIEQVDVANHSKNEFLENMCHDIRTPMTGIIGFARLIQKEAVSEKVQAYANHLVSATTVLLDFQNEILDAIKVSSGVIPVTRHTFELRTLIEKVVNLSLPKSIVKNVKINLAFDEKLPRFVCGDSRRLFRILLELIANALKFTDYGHIDINLSFDQDLEKQFILRCEISDTGIGIPADKLSDVFIRFKRLSAASNGLYEGTGLGLTIVKQFVEDLAGTIHLKSRIGVGSTVICLIPLKTSQSLPDVKETSESLNLETSENSKKTLVLLVEDHEMTAMVTKLMLEETHCQVVVVNDAEQALSICEEKYFDLIFVDVGLPKMDGFELARCIRLNKKTHNHQTPIIALTAHIEMDDADRYIRSGINDILQKPLLKATAVDIVNTYVNKNIEQAPVIDIALGAKRLQRDEAAAIDMLRLLLDNIDKECVQLIAAKKQSDWKQVGMLAHRLMGALVYCGAPRLELVCKQLHDSIKQNDFESAKNQVDVFLVQVNLLKKAFKSTDIQCV